MKSWRHAGLSANRSRNSFRPLLETLEDRTTPTTLSSIAPSIALITDNNAPGSFTLKLVFSGSMNNTIAPTITFPTAGEDPGPSLVPNTAQFVTTNFTNDTFLATYSTTDQNVSIPNIDVRVSGGVDFTNAAVPALTLNDIFGINTTQPIVTQLNVTTTSITTANVGHTFQIAVTYRDQMQNTTNPTIAFSNPNVTNTLVFQSGAWTANNTIYTATYNVVGSGNIIPSINVAVSGAKNLAGFTQIAYSANSVFSINTANNSTAGFPVGSFMRLSGDFNGDGVADIAAYYASSGKFLVALSTGTSFLAPMQWFKFSSGVTLKTLMVGDFNHDGKADIAYFYNLNGTAVMHVARSTGSAFVTSNWVNGNDGKFGVTVWTRFLVGDFNNDGFDDIAAFQNDSSVARWIVNLSTGTGFTVTKWADLHTISVGGWTNAVAGDFNGDGKTDIATFYNKNGVARWFVSISNGTTFNTPFTTNMPNAGVWANQMVGDFNNDGKDDIIAFNSTLNQWWVSLGNNTNTAFATTQWLAFTPSRTTAQKVGDFNHDGKDDLSVLDLSTGQLFVAISNGTNFAVSTWEILPATSLLYVNEFVGDFTGDGKVDLAHFFTNSTQTQIWVSKNNVGTFTTSRWR
jgi:hypothetical protein